MLWDAMGCYGLGWARSGYFRSHGSDATIGWQLLTAGHTGAIGTLLLKKIHDDSCKNKRDGEAASLFLNPEAFASHSIK